MSPAFCVNGEWVNDFVSTLLRPLNKSDKGVVCVPNVNLNFNVKYEQSLAIKYNPMNLENSKTVQFYRLRNCELEHLDIVLKLRFSEFNQTWLRSLQDHGFSTCSLYPWNCYNR
jgi:hypothetical protein